MPCASPDRKRFAAEARPSRYGIWRLAFCELVVCVLILAMWNAVGTGWIAYSRSLVYAASGITIVAMVLLAWAAYRMGLGIIGPSRFRVAKWIGVACCFAISSLLAIGLLEEYTDYLLPSTSSLTLRSAERMLMSLALACFVLTTAILWRRDRRTVKCCQCGCDLLASKTACPKCGTDIANSTK